MDAPLSINQQPVPPIPPDAHEAARWTESRRRFELLESKWKHQLQDKITGAMTAGRASQWSDPDCGSNPFLNICSQTACLYDREPAITNEDAEASSTMATLLRRAGWSGIGQTVQRNAIGMGEMLIRVDVLDTSTGPEVVLRPVTPDHVIAIADHDRPDRPIEIREMRLRTSPETKVREWLWDAWSIKDPTNPTFRILRGDVDVSAEFGGALVGEAYPVRDAGGKPHLPFVMYHARRTGRLWDAFSNSEIVEGTLTVGLHMTFYGHCMLSASWPTRYFAGVRPVASTPLANGISVVEDDPAGAVEFTSVEGYTGQPIIGQWEPGSDPRAMLEAIMQYEQRLAQFAGISASEFTRQSGDPRSAYALLISREGKREAAGKYSQTFADADAELCRLIAVMVNQIKPGSLPESGYSIEYTSIPKTVEEVRANREHVLDLLDRRLISRAQAMAEIEDITLVEAKRRLLEIDADGAQDEADDLPGAMTPKMDDLAPTAPAKAAATAPENDAPNAPAALTPDGVQAASPSASLNGAQVTSAVAIVTAVALGQLPRDSGVSMLVRFFSLSNDAAEEIMGSVGKGFAPVAATPAPAL